MTRKKRPETPLSRRLKETAEAAGLKAEPIAEGLGKTPGAVRHWWGARNEPSYTDLEAYGALVGRSAYYLLTGEDDPALLFRAVENSLATFRELLAAGQEAGAALGAAGGNLAELSESEAASLERAGPSLREYLASAGGESWLRLSEEERALVLELVLNLARGKPPHQPAS